MKQFLQITVVGRIPVRGVADYAKLEEGYIVNATTIAEAAEFTKLALKDGSTDVFELIDQLDEGWTVEITPVEIPE